jgi:hypothetical protein
LPVAALNGHEPRLHRVQNHQLHDGTVLGVADTHIPVLRHLTGNGHGPPRAHPRAWPLAKGVGRRLEVPHQGQYAFWRNSGLNRGPTNDPSGRSVQDPHYARARRGSVPLVDRKSNHERRRRQVPPRVLRCAARHLCAIGRLPAGSPHRTRDHRSVGTAAKRELQTRPPGVPLPKANVVCPADQRGPVFLRAEETRPMHQPAYPRSRVPGPRPSCATAPPAGLPWPTEMESVGRNAEIQCDSRCPCVGEAGCQRSNPPRSGIVRLPARAEGRPSFPASIPLMPSAHLKRPGSSSCARVSTL